MSPLLPSAFVLSTCLYPDYLGKFISMSACFLICISAIPQSQLIPSCIQSEHIEVRNAHLNVFALNATWYQVFFAGPPRRVAAQHLCLLKCAYSTRRRGPNRTRSPLRA